MSRQIFTGSGKVGSENGRPAVDFQMTQRADFFEEEVGLETTLKRPIINTRDEPHADASRYRRLHVIFGDANLSEVQTFLKLGSTAVVLAALEAGALPEPILLEDPVKAAWQVSHDLDLTLPLPLDGGGTMTALEMQWQYLEWATKHVNTVDLGDRVPGLVRALGRGAHRPRSRPDAARRPARLGGQATIARRLRRP